jgi:transposase
MKPEEVLTVWKTEINRAVGIKRATGLVLAAQNSVGIKDGSIAAEFEIQALIEEYEFANHKLEQAMGLIEELIKQIPGSDKLLAINGIGLITVAGFFAEVGDIGRFEHPKQIQKLAGLNLRENSSGKHKGRTSLSKRGRKRSRKILFHAALLTINFNTEFRDLHRYYTTRATNPLKKKQSIMAIACKLIRVFFAILTGNSSFDPNKMVADIKRAGMAA